MEYKKSAFEQGLFLDLSNNAELCGMGTQSYFQAPVNQHTAAYSEIVECWQQRASAEGSKALKLQLQKLINATCYTKLSYNSDFASSKFVEVMVSGLSDAELSSFFMRLAINYTTLEDTRYAAELLQFGLLQQLFDCFAHSGDSTVVTPILIIIRNLVITTDDCYSPVCGFLRDNTDMLLTLFAQKEQEEQGFRRHLYKLLNLILYKNREDLSFLFGTVTYLFENYVKTNAKESLFMFYFALFADGFPEYTKNTNIKNILIDMMNVVRTESLMKILSAIFIKFMNYDFEIVIDLIPRFTDLLLSGFESICISSAFIISQILSFEPEWIVDQQKLAINLINKISDLGYEARIKYLRCLMLLLKICSTDLLENMINHGLISIFKDSCDSEDSSIILPILKTINKIVDIEFSVNNAKLIITEITKDDGIALFNELINMGEEEISNLAQIIIKKLNES